MDERENKPIIWKAILYIIPCFAIFFLAQSLLFLLLLVVGYTICKIPLYGLFPISTIISIFAAYFITTAIQGKIIKNAPTYTLSRRILGVILAVYHTLLLIINLLENGNYFLNIFCIIVSFGFMFLNKDKLKQKGETINE